MLLNVRNIKEVLIDPDKEDRDLVLVVLLLKASIVKKHELGSPS